ncbi:MAG: carboxypeptidase regulatory-like domain-containing protein [Candidatus Methanoperedens sp.]|nr:carboxypeptidase regulatory-like domain-containing protein [Candidatus Methanoperedens sp.]
MKLLISDAYCTCIKVFRIAVLSILLSAWLTISVNIAVADGIDQEQDVRSVIPVPVKDASVVISQNDTAYCESNGGNTQYEHILDIKYNQKPGGTMEIDVDVFIKNPTGCTNGKTCPEYDKSPEYVNVWIDWNGNKVFENNEKVIDDMLTGYKNINYKGNMYASKPVTIPPIAVNSTLLRANLGWNHDPNDPCELSWTWGNVFDKAINIKSEPPIFVDINLTGPPGNETNPLAKYNATLGAIIKEGVGYTVTKIVWAGPGIPVDAQGMKYTYKPADHGIQNINGKMFYTDSGGENGGSGTKNKSFKIFFVKYDKDNGITPNWFEYWTKDKAVPKMEDTTYNASAPGYGYAQGGKVYLAPRAADTHYDRAIVLDNGESFGGPTVTGIDTTAEVIEHELYHIWVKDQWKAGGNFTGKNDSDYNPALCYRSRKYNDSLPDSYEDNISHTRNDTTDTYNLEAKKAREYKCYGDNEYMAMKAANSARGVVENDWAFPGKQSNPPEKAKPKSFEDLFYLPVNATITGNYSDMGVDTDGDGLYEFLTISAEINVTEGGTFSIFSTLSDQNGNEIIWLNEPFILTAGNQTINLNFSGLEIRQNGVDGPYNLSLLLDDQEGIGIDQVYNAYVTSPYLFVDFDRKDVEFSGNYSDAGSDTNDDGFYDNLTINAGVTVAVSGNYELEGWLYDKNGDAIVMAITPQYLYAGNQTSTLYFNGSAIRQHRIDGPYNLTYLKIFDMNNSQIDFAYSPYRTYTYNYTDFQNKSAEFNNSYSDYGKDTDSDGSFNYLIVNAGINVSVAGNYLVSGSLYDSNGSEIVSSSNNYVYLDAGTQSLELNFSGLRLFGHGMDGQYYLKDIILFDGDGNKLDYISDAYTTSSYDHSNFQYLVVLTGKYFDYVTDTDNDGLYENLTVEIELIPKNSGNVVAMARLMDSSGEEIIWANNMTFLNDSQPQKIQLDFDGRYLYGTLMNGPYFVKDAYVYHTGDPIQSDYAYEASTTAAYDHGQFENSGVITGTIMDGGSPVPNAYISINGGDSDYSNSEGKYNLVVLQNGIHTVNIDVPGYASWRILVNNEYMKDGTSINVSSSTGTVTYMNFTPSPFINGTVMDSVSKTGIAGVNVFTNTSISTRTNETGFYSLAVTTGTYDLTAMYVTHYPNSSVTVSTGLSDVVIQDIELIEKQTGNITGTVMMP